MFNRGDRPMIVLDRDGHGIAHLGRNDVSNGPTPCISRPTKRSGAPTRAFTSFVTAPWTARSCSTLGTPGAPAPIFSGQPFNRPTQTALTPDGDILVADGYGNARVHKYAPDGRWLMSWGEFGTDPGQFNVVHNITCDDDGFVYIADRENYRIQVFDTAGKFVTQWHNLFRPCGLYMHGTRQPIFFVGELGPFLAINRRFPNIGPRISILDHKGQVAGPSRRAACRHRGRHVHRAAHAGDGFARRFVCRRGLVFRVGACVPRRQPGRGGSAVCRS